MKILVSETTHNKIEESDPGLYQFERREEIEIKVSLSLVYSWKFKPKILNFRTIRLFRHFLLYLDMDLTVYLLQETARVDKTIHKPKMMMMTNFCYPGCVKFFW